jgi:hypothetical protein
MRVFRSGWALTMLGADNEQLRAHAMARSQVRFANPLVHENPLIRRYSRGIGKSLFVSDCVVGPGGLELLTKRLSAASPGLGQGAPHAYYYRPSF